MCVVWSTASNKSTGATEDITIMCTLLITTYKNICFILLNYILYIYIYFFFFENLEILQTHILLLCQDFDFVKTFSQKHFCFFNILMLQLQKAL